MKALMERIAVGLGIKERNKTAWELLEEYEHRADRLFNRFNSPLKDQEYMDSMREMSKVTALADLYASVAIMGKGR